MSSAADSRRPSALAQAEGANARGILALVASRWSIASRNSLLSVGSCESVLSIGSVGSVLSIGSVGAFASFGSMGSAMSLVSLGSFQARWSALSGQSDSSVLSWQAKQALRGYRARGTSLSHPRLLPVAVVLATALGGAIWWQTPRLPCVHERRRPTGAASHSS